MRIFVSYARVDKPFCIQIVTTLDVHDVWFDDRLYAGQDWWKEILRRLDWCEGFVYLLSPDSVKSEYCQKELEIAQSLGRHIFPVVIHPDTPIPTSLDEIQFVDLSKGLTADNVRVLLNSIYAAEHFVPNRSGGVITSESLTPPAIDNSKAVGLAATAMERGEFDKAVFLLKLAQENGYVSRFINMDKMLLEAEAALERQAYMREAERDYKQILELVKHSRTRAIGCEAFGTFHEAFPDYDPDNLAVICGLADKPRIEPLPPTPARNNGVSHNEEETIPSRLPVTDTLARFRMPLLEFCAVPSGIVKVDTSDKGEQQSEKPQHVEAFQMAKYPVTNAQYRIFLQDPKGYANLDWWKYDKEAYEWRVGNPTPQDSTFKGDERPREMVNWYDALAFCRWLSSKMNAKIMLPTFVQRQRAIQGDDDRMFPWGDAFDKNRCNTHESEIKMTTLVTRYPAGVSPYGIFDLAGNVWEWCLNIKHDDDQSGAGKRIVHGGSFVSPYQRAKVSFRYYLNPQIRYSSIGFRVIMLV